jgi:hypothetical protein
MAVIGARPATGFWFLGRRPRPRNIRAPQRSRVRHAGAGRRQRQASVAGLLATIAAAAGLAFFYLSQSSHVAAVGYEIDNLHAQIASLRADQQQLILQIGSAQSPTTIIGQATSQLKLRQLAPSSVSFARRASATPTSRPSPEPAH